MAARTQPTNQAGEEPRRLLWGHRSRPITDPTPAEVRGATLWTNRLLSPYYARFVRSLELTGDERVIDFGSGSGAEARHLAAVLARGGGHLTCIDVSPAWLRAAQRELRGRTNVEFLLGDVPRLGLETASFDVVAIHFVLHDIEVEERRPAVDGLARALRPGGRIVLREPLRAGHGISAAEITTLMSDAGLRPRDVRPRRYPVLGNVVDATFHKPGPRADGRDPAGSGPGGPGRART